MALSVALASGGREAATRLAITVREGSQWLRENGLRSAVGIVDGSGMPMTARRAGTERYAAHHASPHGILGIRHGPFALSAR